MDTDTLTKECFRCHNVKPLTEYYRTKLNKDGRKGTCKECYRIEAKEKYIYTERWERLHHASELIPQGFNECKDCGQVKPLCDFYKDTRYQTGYRPRCRECFSQLERQRCENRIKRFSKNVVPKTKECLRCHRVQQSDQFNKDRSSSDLLVCYCRECMSDIARDNRRKKKHPNLPKAETKSCSLCHDEKPTLQFRLNSAKNGFCDWCIDCERKTRKKHKDDSTWAYQQLRYGVTHGEYELMVEKQDHRCAICGRHETDIPKRVNRRVLCIDHCHKTNKVRELLCDDCNSGLGRFRDNPDTLMKAAQYILKHKGQECISGQ